MPKGIVGCHFQFKSQTRRALWPHLYTIKNLSMCNMYICCSENNYLFVCLLYRPRCASSLLRRCTALREKCTQSASLNIHNLLLDFILWATEQLGMKRKCFLSNGMVCELNLFHLTWTLINHPGWEICEEWVMLDRNPLVSVESVMSLIVISFISLFNT